MNQVIEKQVEINAPVENVWRVFTEPAITRQMGGEYATDWKVGSDFGWKGPDGTMYTYGKILQVEPERLIQHNLFDMEDKNTLLSVITYRFKGDGATTILSAREELHGEMPDDALAEASEGWDYALQAVKVTAEKL